MRKLSRLPLSSKASGYLARRQTAVNRAAPISNKVLNGNWKAARQTKSIRDGVLSVLKKMAGDRERCMYCEDSHGADIDHHWPKAKYHNRVFNWPNMILSCSECGRIKGDQFPLDAQQFPLLIDPTSDDPWQFLEFDPNTGNLSPKFDSATQSFVPKGESSVKVLQLDRREALGNAYLRSFKRIANVVNQFLTTPVGNRSIPDLANQLNLADEHGIIEWCFKHSGQTEPPFKNLRSNHASEWQQLIPLL